MAFRFSLQKLLRLRQSYEDMEKQRLAKITGHLYQLRAQYDHGKREKQQAETKLLDLMKAGMVAVEFQFDRASLDAEGGRLKRTIVEISHVEQQRQARHAAYVEAQKTRKILESLQARELNAYRIAQGRREQREIDDLFVIRQGTNNG